MVSRNLDSPLLQIARAPAGTLLWWASCLANSPANGVSLTLKRLDSKRELWGNLKAEKDDEPDEPLVYNRHPRNKNPPIKSGMGSGG